MLPPETSRVWDFMREQPLLRGFVLVGGSALALRIRHRLSEDLDLLFPARELPKSRLDAFIRLAEMSGYSFRPNDSPAAVEAFAHGGMDVRDFQRDFVANGAVKVTFFAEEGLVQKASPEPDNVRVAELAELFRAKCRVSAARGKSRDWLDLYLLLTRHGFTDQDFIAAFDGLAAGTMQVSLARLAAGVPGPGDEGYQHLLPDAPKLRTMAEYFTSLRDQIEQRQAEERRRSFSAGTQS